MESLGSLWNKLNLSDSESNGVDCPTDSFSLNLVLAAKLLTKRTVKVEAVARTFRSLWRHQKDFRIKDMGENRLFFIFEDKFDVERVLEHEPWTYNKHLVVFERVLKNVPISALPFQFSNFWVQIHDLPVHYLTPATRKSIGNSIGTVLETAELEEECGKVGA